MPLFRVVLRQAYNGPEAAFKWSNIFYVNEGGLDGALARGQQFAQIQRQVLDSNAFVYEIYASDLIPLSDVFSNQDTGENKRGLLAATGRGDLLPAWNTVRLDLTMPVGRPSRKFIRIPLREVDITYDSFSVTLAQTLEDYGDALEDSGGVVDEGGQPLVSVVTRGITSRRLGREAGLNVPALPVT